MFKHLYCQNTLKFCSIWHLLYYLQKKRLCLKQRGTTQDMQLWDSCISLSHWSSAITLCTTNHLTDVATACEATLATSSFLNNLFVHSSAPPTLSHHSSYLLPYFSHTHTTPADTQCRQSPARRGTKKKTQQKNPTTHKKKPPRNVRKPCILKLAESHCM